MKNRPVPVVVQSAQDQTNAELLPLDALRGLDSAVVEGFLELADETREQVMVDYTVRHGEAAGTWLRRAAQLWPMHRLGVSRVILARLFAVLPEHMSQPERLELAKSIWHTARAPTRAVLRVPTGYRNHTRLTELVRTHFMAVLPSAMELPEALRSRVAWLNDPALQAQHDVLNLLLLAERDQLLLLADEQIEVLFARRMEGIEIRSTLRIAGHELLLRTDVEAQEPALRIHEQRLSRSVREFDTRAPQSALTGALIGVVIALVLMALIFLLSGE